MSSPAMDKKPMNRKISAGQLIFVPHKDTIRLLEVYVKRSLSLNDGTLGLKKEEDKEKFVTIPRRPRRHSSDPSLHLIEESKDDEIGPFSVVGSHVNQPEPIYEESKPPPKKTKKKPSLWRSLLNIFSRKGSEDKDEEEESPPEIHEVSQEIESPETLTTCLPTTPITSQKKKIRKRKSIKRRMSKKRLSRFGKDLNPDDITRVENILSVEPTYSYFENMSQELEKIVQEVQEKEEELALSDEEIINRIIALTKEEGDAINKKLKENPTLDNFFQRMSYSSFQILADAYLDKEASPVHNPPTVLPTAPELVKLAFAYDFTAKVARLSKQNVGHITGLGNRYLQDRFEYKQACTDHPLSDSEG
ncbi:apoptosis facilitator Bcl-2-like protein 14 [Antennarius striatus]|uniref:apoptosis facilitator Bcl-2-like protein 14 n=1 Tax=Antennarius striatus TaxID=241820 RepID=UPI0035AE81D1